MTNTSTRSYQLSNVRREREVVVVDSSGRSKKWRVWGLDVLISGFEDVELFVHRSIHPQTGYTLSERTTGQSIRINPSTSDRANAVVKKTIVWFDQNGITAEKLKEQIALRKGLSDVTPTN